MDFKEFKTLVETESGSIFNVVANEGWRMDKDMLINILKELDYAAYDSVSKTKHAEITADTLKALEECYSE